MSCLVVLGKHTSEQGFLKEVDWEMLHVEKKCHCSGKNLHSRESRVSACLDHYLWILGRRVRLKKELRVYYLSGKCQDELGFPASRPWQ